MERNELCWCGSGKKYKRCHMAMEEKMEQLREAGHIVPGRELLKTPAQIEAIKKSAELNTAVLDHVAKHIHAGLSTEYSYTISPFPTVAFRLRLAMKDSRKVYALL